MTKKEWLMRASEARREIARLEECIALERTEFERVTARYADAPGGGSPDPHKLDHYVARVEKYNRQIEKERAIITERERAILKIPRKEYRDVLRLRYIKALPWTKVASKMQYSERRTFQLHSAAMKKFKFPSSTNEKS